MIALFHGISDKKIKMCSEAHHRMHMRIEFSRIFQTRPLKHPVVELL